MELLTRLPQFARTRCTAKVVDASGAPQCYRWKRPEPANGERDSQPDLPEAETPAIAESLVQQTQEEQMLREAMGVLAPKCRRLIELLFFETPSRP